MVISREHQWVIIQRNQVEQVSILCSVLLEKQWTFFMESSVQGRLIVREIFLRADSGFYDGDFLYYLEMRRVLYAIVVKLYPWIQMELIGLKYRHRWRNILRGDDVYRNRMEKA